MGVADTEGAGPRQVLTGFIAGLLLISCIIGWGAAVSIIQPQYRYIPDIVVVTTTQESRGISYVACGQDCSCLAETEAQARFGTGYVRCSEYSCGSETSGNGDLVFTIPKYCYQAQQRLVSYAACGQGCSCLMASEAQVQFGGNYVQCSETACGQGYYCFRAGQSSYVPPDIPPVQPQVPAAATGSLSVSSSPSDAAVYVDTLYKGKTPAIISGLAPGYHTVKLSRAGYLDATQSALVDAGEVTGLSIPLVPLAVPAVYRDSGIRAEQPDDEVTAVKLADEAVVLNQQRELPKPDEYPVLDTRTEPSKTAPGGFLDLMISYFTGLFGGNIQNTSQTAPRADGSIFPSLHLPWDTPCSGTGAERCNGRCANTQSDPDNCGACGSTCNPEQVCSRGTCLSLNPAGMKPGWGKSIASTAAMPALAEHAGVLNTCTKCHDTKSINTDAAANLWVGKDGTPLSRSLAMPAIAEHAGVLNTCTKCHDTGSEKGNTPAVPWVIRDSIPLSEMSPSAAMPETAEHIIAFQTCSRCHDTQSGNAEAPAIPWVGKDSTPPSELSPSAAMPETAEHIIAFQTCTECHSTGSGNTDVPAVQWAGKDGIPGGRTAAIPAIAEHTGILNTCTKCHGTGTDTGGGAGIPWIPLNRSLSEEATMYQAMPDTAVHLEAMKTCSKCHASG